MKLRNQQFMQDRKAFLSKYTKQQEQLKQEFEDRISSILREDKSYIQEVRARIAKVQENYQHERHQQQPQPSEVSHNEGTVYTKSEINKRSPS